MLGLSLLRNQTETLATQAILRQNVVLFPSQCWIFCFNFVIPTRKNQHWGGRNIGMIRTAPTNVTSIVGKIAFILDFHLLSSKNTQTLKYSNTQLRSYLGQDVLTCAFSYGLNMGKKTQVKSFPLLSIIFLPCAVSYLKVCVMYMRHLCG